MDARLRCAAIVLLLIRQIAKRCQAIAAYFTLPGHSLSQTYAFLVAERGRFSPQELAEARRGSRRLEYPAASALAEAPIRPERRVPTAMATMRRRLIVGVGRRLERCPCCQRGRPPTEELSTQERTRKYDGPRHMTEMERWDADYLNMEVQAFIRIAREGGGEFQFGLVSGQIAGESGKRPEGDRFEFTWDGNDEWDEASGSGGLALGRKNKLEGTIKIHRGDSSTLVAERAPKSKPRK